MTTRVTTGPSARTRTPARKFIPPKAYRWPPLAALSFYNRNGDLQFVSNDTSLDLADTLMTGDWESKTVIMGITSRGKTWPTWTERRLQHVEALIRYDLEFDAYEVRTRRLTERRWGPCTREFRWELLIRPMGA